MVVAALGVSLLAWLSYHEADKIFRQHSANTLLNNSRMYAQKITKEMGALKYDLTMFSLNDSIKGLLRAMSDPYRYDAQTNKTANQFLKEIANLFIVMAEQNQPYFQIRLIDARNGMEVVRIDKEGRKIIVVPKKRLQNKWHRDYVQKSLALRSGEIYISPITLNREHHTLEVPYRPTIRASMLLYHQGRKRYIVIINANVKELLDFAHFRKNRGVATYVADEKGYYLFNPEAPQKEFAFEFGQNYLVTDDFPIAPIYRKGLEHLSWYDAEAEKLYEATRIDLSPERFIVVVKQANSMLFKEKSREYIVKMMLYVGFIALLIAVVAAVLARRMTRPIGKLTEYAHHIAETGGHARERIDIRTGDEIEELAHSFEAMLDALLRSREEIEKFAQNLEEEVRKKTRDLQRLNAELEEKVRKGIEELREKDEIMLQQSKLADMGEMIGAIAHQWRQPLNVLALNIQMLEDMAADGELDEANVEAFVEKNMKTIQFMSKTIDDFRNFYRSDNKREIFDLKEAVEATLSLQRAQLEAREIALETDLSEVKVEGYPNELMQVILNLISNARDAIEQRREREKGFQGKIRIMCGERDGKAILRIEDNGGGIPKEVLERIFEPYFTTKEVGKGTGLGLHMARRIVEEKMGGRIRVLDSGEGAVFEIVLEKADAKQAE
jgi:signal transduction histidine kinase